MQKEAAKFLTGSYTCETESMTGIPEKIKWESPKKRRKDSKLIFYKGL